MFLKTLNISTPSSVIREIHFHKGLNLIVDETTTVTLQESGNNVGKTTVLRLIDFCLGGNGKNIYQDTEFKEKINTVIESFLKSQQVVITLVMKEDLNIPSSIEIAIRRNFLSRSDKIQEINNQYYNDADFDMELKRLIFKTAVHKPTFRQISSKNIRYENARIENTLRVLHYNTTFEEYESLYFFWFGIYTDTAERKQRLQVAKSTEESLLKRLRKDSSVSEIEQALTVIERDIIEFSYIKDNFSINDNYENDFNRLHLIQININKLSSEINRWNVRRDVILEASSELENEYANIDVNQLASLYKTAQHYITEIQVRFEELVTFHNNMLKERINFISNELPIIENALIELNSELEESLLQERLLSKSLNQSGAVGELESTIQKLNLKYEQKGKYEEQLRQWKLSTDKLQSIEEELNSINQGIASRDQDLENRIKEFNKYFSKISEFLYDEQFIISSEKTERAYVLKISSIGGNLGTGKKKGQIAAFDFAYIQFCENNDLHCLHFILHDQIESIHDNQLTLIAQVANETNSQFIAPVLQDKLPQSLDVNLYKILSLSEDDKLFRI